MEHHKDVLKDLCRLCSSKVIPNKGYKNPKALGGFSWKEKARNSCGRVYLKFPMFHI